MKSLYILRHAKSSWENQLPDHKRPINSRGKNDIELISKHVVANFEKPQLIKTSNAVRTVTTAKAFKEAFGVADSKYIEDSKMYDFSAGGVLRAIEETSNAIDILMVCAHNHGLTHLVNKLGDKYIENLPTTGFVHITFDTDDWQDLGSGQTQTILFPKDFK